jgi:hypothetical protein
MFYPRLLYSLLALSTTFLILSIQAYPVTKPHRSELICTSATWQLIIEFFLLNYVSHAVTVKSMPGRPMANKVLSIVAALLLPFSGVLRGCMAIASGKVKGETDLQHASHSGALCMLV